MGGWRVWRVHTSQAAWTNKLNRVAVCTVFQISLTKRGDEEVGGEWKGSRRRAVCSVDVWGRDQNTNHVRANSLPASLTLCPPYSPISLSLLIRFHWQKRGNKI